MCWISSKITSGEEMEALDKTRLACGNCRSWVMGTWGFTVLFSLLFYRTKNFDNNQRKKRVSEDGRMKNPEPIPLFLNVPQKLTDMESKLPIEGIENSTVHREQIRETKREHGTIQPGPCPCGIHTLGQEANNHQIITQTLLQVLEREAGGQSMQ